MRTPKLGQSKRQLFRRCPAFLGRKMRVPLLHPQAAVSNFKPDDFLVHALVLHFAHPSMSECVHPAMWDSDRRRRKENSYPPVLPVNGLQTWRVAHHENDAVFLGGLV